MDVNNKQIGQRIRKERTKLNLTREEFAEIVGLSDFYIGQLERGERQMSLPAMVNIACHLHSSLDYLILGKDDQGHSFIKDDAFNDYESYNDASDAEKSAIINELFDLLLKCSPKELDLIHKLIKTILPYIGH